MDDYMDPPKQGPQKTQVCVVDGPFAGHRIEIDGEAPDRIVLHREMITEYHYENGLVAMEVTEPDPEKLSVDVYYVHSIQIKSREGAITWHFASLKDNPFDTMHRLWTCFSRDARGVK